MSRGLIVFAKEPILGRCKTRLIPSLGKEGATELYQRLVHHTRTTVARLERADDIAVHWFVDSESPERFAEAFDVRATVHSQADGDLGHRMRCAFERLFAMGLERVLIIGTDSPRLDANRMIAAYERLADHDVCIIPANDGGYVGLATRATRYIRSNELADQLFSDLPWGTKLVLQRTLERLDQLNVQTSLLESCPDVDLPEDLPDAEEALNARYDQNIELEDQYDSLVMEGKAQHNGSEYSAGITVVIPVLNAESRLASAIESAIGSMSQSEVEVIVVGAGQTLQTKLQTAAAGCQFIESEIGRGRQMNAGAKHARHDILLFLHADSRLPKDYQYAVRRAVCNEQFRVGAFRFRVDSQKFKYRLLEFFVRCRCYLLRLPYGDQAIFTTRNYFESQCGFATLPIMEDFQFVQQAKKDGRLVLLNEGVLTSARRWEKLGIFRTTIINQIVVIGYYLGVPLDILRSFYRSR